MSMMQRDVVYFTSQKLQGDWSAADFGKHLNSDFLNSLLPKYDRLEPLVRVRLLLSVLTLDKLKLGAIHQELKALLALAKDDKEEWVSITARALNDFEAPLNLQAVVAGSTVVERTVKDMEAQLDEGNSSGFQPLENLYLSPSLLQDSDDRQPHTLESHHFQPRNGGANSLEELYKKANESAAAAVNSIKAHPIRNQAARPQSNPKVGKNADTLAGFRARPTASAMPLARQRPTSSHSGIGKSVAESDMFRPSRPPDLGARPAATTGHYDRKPQNRPGGVKLLDVSEVKRLNRNPNPSPMRSEASPHTSGQMQNGQARIVRVEEESEEEDGEIEDGEFAEDAQSGPSLKRPRHTIAMS